MDLEMAERDLEWRKIERVTTVLGLEHTEKEAVRSPENGSPNQYRQLLSLDVLHAGDLHCECDCGK
jgi:hypothetical protein